MQAGVSSASTAYQRYRKRLPWSSRPSFYAAVARGEIPAVRLGAAVYVPVWALEALPSGDLETLAQRRRASRRLVSRQALAYLLLYSRDPDEGGDRARHWGPGSPRPEAVAKPFKALSRFPCV